MILPAWVHDYTKELREEAERRRSLWPQDPLASVLPELAKEIELKAESFWLESLTVPQAAAETGYSEDYLYRALKEGRLRNIGKERSPRVRRCDLGRKSAKGTGPSGTSAVDEILARKEAS